MEKAKVMKVKDPKTIVVVDKIEFEINTISIDVRCSIMDKIITNEGQPSFSIMIDVILLATNFDKDELNRYSNKTLGSLFSEIVQLCDVNSDKKK